MSTVRVAFYKGKGRFFDKLIKWWTKSDYSHVELLLGSEMFSASSYSNLVRWTFHNRDESKWDYYDVPTERPLTKELVKSLVGHKYDWLGIMFSIVVPLGLHSSNKYFCSEICSDVLYTLGADIEGIPNKMSPNDLAEEILYV